MQVKTIPLKMQEDPRGWSADLFRHSEIDMQVRYIYLITSKPGTMRGNHYHLQKSEWFCLVKGKAKFTMVDNKTEERRVFMINGKRPILINIPPNVTHTVENVGDEDAYMIEIGSEEYDKSNPDTFKKQIV